ncbi:MAG: methionyl-tRNA formyltransferase, partial [Parcubacteria group bacterium]
MKIVFMGTPEFGGIILEKLVKNDFRPVLVITETDKPAGRKKIVTPPPVKILANEYKIPVLQPEKILNLKSEILNLNPDLIIVAAYGQILTKEILEIPKFGCLNVHPSLLPEYRGPSPIQYAILNGDPETGVSIILLDEKIDHGEIVASIK